MYERRVLYMLVLYFEIYEFEVLLLLFFDDIYFFFKCEKFYHQICYDFSSIVRYFEKNCVEAYYDDG